MTIDVKLELFEALEVANVEDNAECIVIYGSHSANSEGQESATSDTASTEALVRLHFKEQRISGHLTTQIARDISVLVIL